MRLTRSFGKSEVITDFGAKREGGHGGADSSLHDLIFRGLPQDDPLGLRADLRAGALASLIGIAARRSIERGGSAILNLEGNGSANCLVCVAAASAFFGGNHAN